MKYIYLHILIGLAFLCGCTKDFDQINTNPNAPIDVQPSFLLRQIIYDYGEQMAYEGFVAGNLLGQYFTAVDFNLFDRHSLSEPQFGGNPWPFMYQNLMDNEILLNKATTNPLHQVYEIPARILKAYIIAALTDIYGDVPYSEALQGKSGLTNPSYDKQETIYLGENGILHQLDQAIEAINDYQGTQKIEGDVLYDGDLNLWRKLAYSLKLKFAMRLGEKIDIISTLNGLNDPDRLIWTAEDNARFSFTDSAPNNFRMATARAGDFNLFVMSETMQEILLNLNDPRTGIFFRRAENSNLFQGLLNGPDASATSISIGDYSLSGEIFRESTSRLQANFMTSWEVHFLLAEAALKGYLDGDAEAHYNTGISNAIEYWGIPFDPNYFSQVGVQFEFGTALEQIITQKWIASITNGYEGWIEFRRTGFPKLKKIAASLNNELIPVRMPYPSDEEALNSEHYIEAASATDNNSINAKVWWDSE